MPTESFSAGYRNYVLLLIFLIAVFNVCDRTIVSVLADDIGRDLELNDRQLGFVMGMAFSITYALAAIPVARLADRYSRKNIISAAIVVWSVMTALAGLTQNFWQMVLARLGVGLGEGSSGAASQSLITDYVEPSRRARSMALIAIGSLVGMGGGIMYGGWAAEIIGWRWALISVGIPGVLLGVLFFTTVIEPKRRASDLGTEGQFNDESLITVVAQLFRLRPFVLLTAAAAMINVVSMGKNFWEPTFLRRVYDMSAADAGVWYFFISPLPAALGAYLSGLLLDRLSARDQRWYGWLPGIAAIVLVPLSLGFYLMPTDWMLAGMPVAFIFSIASSAIGACWGPATMSVAQGMVPAGARAVAAASWSTLATFIGLGLGPLLVGDFNERLQPLFSGDTLQYALSLVSVLPLLAGYFYFRMAASLATLGTQAGNQT